jgi:tellurite resistance protein
MIDTVIGEIWRFFNQLGIVPSIFLLLLIGRFFEWLFPVLFFEGGSGKGSGPFSLPNSQKVDTEENGALGFLQVRFADRRLGDDGSGPLCKEIEGRGAFPIARPVKLGFITSVFDKTTGELEPVLSTLEAFQESTSVVYQHRLEVGAVTPEQGFLQWVRVGAIFPELLQPPQGGVRHLVAILRMVDMDNLPTITHGYHQGEPPGLLWQQVLDFDYTFNEKGYKEAAAHRDEARAIAVKMGIAVAMTNGSLDQKEGETLKNWIIRTIAPFSEEKQKELKALYNTAMKEAYAAAKNGSLGLESLTQRLNEIGEKSIKYEVVDLCFEVMAADGIADVEELKTIRSVSEALGIDMDEIGKMRDQKILGLNTAATNQASIEDILGIESAWDNERIRKYLRLEFQKWNNRLNTLDEGEERSNAQRMLDLIAEARKKYA